MRQGGMDKMARAVCSHCSGQGVIRVPRSTQLRGVQIKAHPTGDGCGPGFVWVGCVACNNTGRR